MPDPDRDDDRAELAFRDAFTRYADDLEPQPLAPVTRDRRWPAVAAAAAIVAVLAGATLVATGVRDDDGAATPSTSTSTPPTLSVPHRNVTYRGVSVEVPAAWVDSYIPSNSPCGYAPEPFVATSQPGIAYADVGCPYPSPRSPDGFPQASVAEWVPNVQIQDVYSAQSSPEGSRTYEGWTLTRRTIGDVVVQVLADTATATLAQEVVASGHEVDIDPNGCRSTSPVQEAAAVRPAAFDVTQIEATSILVCLYGRGNPTKPGIVASRRIEGVEAQDVLAAIQAAPAGGGPDQPRNCQPSDFGELALSLRLDDGETPGPELYVTFQSCHDNGFDDGTTLRELTPKSCRPLFGGRVQFNSGSSASYRVCHPPSEGA